MFRKCLNNALLAGNGPLAATLIGNAPMNGETLDTIEPIVRSFSSAERQGFRMSALHRAQEQGDEETFEALLSGIVHAVKRLSKDRIEELEGSVAWLDRSEYGSAVGRAMILDDELYVVQRAERAIANVGGILVRSYYHPDNLTRDFEAYKIDLTGIYVFFLDCDLGCVLSGYDVARWLRSWGVSSTICMASSFFKEPADVADKDYNITMGKVCGASPDFLRTLLGL